MQNSDHHVVTRITLYADAIIKNDPPYVYAKQYDADSRYLVVTIKSANGIVNIPTSSIVQLNATKPDGTPVFVSGVVNEDGTATFLLKTNLLSTFGELSCDISVFGSDGDNPTVLTTSTFYIIVDYSNYNSDAVEGANEFTAATEALARMAAMQRVTEEARNDAVEACNAAEDARINAEEARNAATAAANSYRVDDIVIKKEGNEHKVYLSRQGETIGEGAVIPSSVSKEDDTKGWTPAQITLLDNFRVALDALMSHLGYDVTNGDTYADAVTSALSALVDSLRSGTEPDVPDEPDRTLVGLSVSPQEITIAAGATDLSMVATALTVLATYDSGDPDTLVYGDTYTLTVSGSDTLSTGVNTVTVSGTGVYDGLTAVDITVNIPSVEVPTHAVTFMADGVTVGTVTYYEGQTNITEPDVPHRDHYIGAWEDYTLGTTGITVVAVYTPIIYTITFRDDAGDHPKTYTALTADSVSAPAITPRDGHTSEWPTFEIGYDDRQVVEAVYTIKSYTVTFNLQGHGTQVAPQTVTHGGTATQPTAPTADGWTFGGWYTDASCTMDYNFGSVVTSHIVLYAKWTEVAKVTKTHCLLYNNNSNITPIDGITQVTSNSGATSLGASSSESTKTLALRFSKPLTNKPNYLYIMRRKGTGKYSTSGTAVADVIYHLENDGVWRGRGRNNATSPTVSTSIWYSDGLTGGKSISCSDSAVNWIIENGKYAGINYFDINSTGSEAIGKELGGTGGDYTILVASDEAIANTDTIWDQWSV